MDEVKVHPLQRARKRLGIKQKTLADFTGLSVPTIKRAERGEVLGDYTISAICEFFSQKYGRSVDRRELGLRARWDDDHSAISSQREKHLNIVDEPSTDLEARGNVQPLTFQAYEDMLTLAWEAFYTSNAQRATSAVDHWLLFLKEQANSASTVTLQQQMLTFLCRFHQLGSVLARDRTDFPNAFATIHKAIAVAFQLGDVELIASSLYRRAKLYAAQRRYEQALTDLEAALPYAKRSRSPLRCYISMFLAEVYSLFAPGDKECFQKSLKQLDTVDQAVREHGILEGDGSFVKVDVSGLYMIRGDVLRRNGEIEKARNALTIVQESLPKEFTRWQGNLHLSKSQLFLAEGDVANSCKQIYDALDIFQATNSRSGLAKTRRIYRTVQNVEATRSDVKELGIRLSTR